MATVAPPRYVQIEPVGQCNLRCQMCGQWSSNGYVRRDGPPRPMPLADWKRLVTEQPPHLSPQIQELGSQLYMALANELTGRRWFEGAWPLAKVVEGMDVVDKIAAAARQARVGGVREALGDH